MKKLGALYYVSKDMLTEADIAKLSRELSLESRENKLYFADKKQINLLYDYGDHIAVPRAYGIRYFGVPLQSELAYGDEVDIIFKGTLRDDQPRIVDTVLAQRYPNGLISMPPGTGKTVLAIKIISELKTRSLVLVPRTFLLNQWKKRFIEFTNLSEDDIGLIRGKKCEFDKPVSIGMVSSVSKKEYPAEFYRSFGCIVLDEVHHFGAETWRLCLDKFPAVSRVGLSATMSRGDGLERVFRYHIGDIIASSFGQKLTPEVFIFKYKAELPGHYYFGKDEKKKTNMPGAISDLCAIESRNNLIVRVVTQAIDKGRKIFILSDRLSHLSDLEIKMKSVRPSVTTGKYIGKMKDEELEASEQCQVIFGTYGFCKESLDLPSLDTLVLSSPRGGLQQSIGRILRELPCKKPPVVVDIADESPQLAELKLLSDNRRKFYVRNGYTIKDF